MRRTNRQKLGEVIRKQSGLFTTRQAASCGFSWRALSACVKRGEFVRLQQGIYRVGYYHNNVSPVEVLVRWWLWSDQQAVFCGETALALHLGDPIPPRVHIMLPVEQRKRRRRRSRNIVLHFADLKTDEVVNGHHDVPITSIDRTFVDCENWNVSSETLERARLEAKAFGLIADT